MLTDEQGHLLYCTCLKVYEAFYPEEPKEGNALKAVFRRADTRIKTSRPEASEFPSFELTDVGENSPIKRSQTLGD